jgi:hypothetical protein
MNTAMTISISTTTNTSTAAIPMCMTMNILESMDPMSIPIPAMNRKSMTILIEDQILLYGRDKKENKSKG